MRSPHSAVGFDWDDWNVDKLSLRSVRPDEVERMFEEGPRFFRNKRKGTARWLMEGKDPVSGKHLRVGVIWHDQEAGILRAIHALVVR